MLPCIGFALLALLVVITVGGFAGFSIAGILAGIAATLFPKRDSA